MSTARREAESIDLGAVKLSLSDYASQGNAILGIRDSGKTYTATVLAEGLLQSGIPFIAFDPIGLFKFLRHGSHPFEVLVAGGESGDVPLTRENAVPIVRHAMTKNIPLVFDLYDMTMSKADWRHIVSTTIRALLYENKKHGRRHIFIEEAAEFVPQMVSREYGDVYAEIEKLARMGGNAMLGYTLINQRAEQINKAVLELCDCLFLHRQKGRLSLTALSKWLDFGDKKTGGEVIQSLPTLNQGVCWIWSAGEEKPVLTKIPPKLSFHPNRREHTDAGPMPPVPHLLDGLELPTKEKKATADRIEGPPAPEPEIIKVPVFESGDLARLEQLYESFRGFAEKSEVIAENARSIADTLKQCLVRADALNAPRPAPRPPTVRVNGSATTAAKGPRKILETLASRHPLRLTFSQLGTISGYTPSTMRTYFPGLREAGFIDETVEGITLTPSGLASLGKRTAHMPSGGRELLDFWKRKLNAGEAKILETLYEHRTIALSMDRLISLTGYTESTLRTYLPPLRKNNLVDPMENRISKEFR